MEKNGSSLREIVYNQLIEDIVYGRINPGEKLLETELAVKFKVSRTPIREALLQLEKKGYIVHRKNVGAVVEKISLKQEEEFFDLIAVLEEHAIGIVAKEKLKREDGTYLKDLQREMEGLCRARNYFRYLEKNQEFHNFFVQRCGNETLYYMVSDLRRKIFRFLARGFTLPTHIDIYLAAHKKIIASVCNGKSSKAGELMRNHILDEKRFILQEQIRF